MPALPAVPNVLRVTYEFSDGLDFQAIVREFWKYSGTPPTDATCATIASDIYTAWVTRLIAELGSVNQILGVKVVDLSSATAGAGVHAAITGGTRSGLGFAGGTAVLVNKRILRRYRGGKPRGYWPFFTVDDFLTPQGWKSASVSGLQTALGLFYGDVAAILESGCQLLNEVNVSYYHGFASVQNPVTLRWKNINTPRATPIVDDVVASTVHAQPASQRRRNQTN